MKTVVIMPGGFHPFHAGHYALYQQAQDAFPGADVYVAATNDTSSRPFPFALKEKLARLAGVNPGKFIQVKSPFQAREVTDHFDPADTQLIFVRSEKDADKPPRAGGVKKDGNPAYLQPYIGNEKGMQSFAKHAYMAYLPTVEFGPGFTSATEIRTAWPTLNEKRKTALVMSLYPKTQSSPALAANVVKMLDTAMGVEELNEFAPDGFNGGDDPFDPDMAQYFYEKGRVKGNSAPDGVDVNFVLKNSHIEDQYKKFWLKGWDEGRKEKKAFWDKEQGVVEGVVYNTLNIDNQNLIDQKAKSKPDGLYTFRGIMFRVRNGRVTHYAAEGTILVSFGNFNSAVGSYSTRDEAKAKLKSIKEGVAEGANDTVYPGAEVIKSKNGKPVGEIYQDGNSWGAFHYKADRGYDFIDSREEALEWLKDLHDEYRQDRSLEEAGITRRGILKGIGAAAAAGAAGKASAIAGAFPTPSHQAAMYKAAADSNRAMAAQEVERQRQANAARASKLAADTKDVERLNKVNYHGGNSPKPTNATWDGDSDFLDLDGTQYTMASRMPISGNEPRDMKLIATKEGHQVYIWTRYRMKGDGGHYFYPAEKPSTINEGSQVERKISRIQAMIQDYYNRSRETRNDIKRDHYIDMARQLEFELEGIINDANEQERDSNMVSQHDEQPSDTWNRGGLNEFAPGNGDDDKPTAEYEVYQCQPDDQFEWIGGPLMQTDDMGKAHSFAYFLWKKHPDKCFMIWQERSQGSRGGYGPKGSVLAPSEEDLTESGNEYILYINDKPAAKYQDIKQAEQDLYLIKSKVPTSKFEIKQEVCNMVPVPAGLREALLKEFAPDEGGGSRKFIPWTEFIEQVKQIVSKDFSCKENVVKSTIKARFVPHDPMEYGPTMLYSYYETRAGGRNKGAVSTRGSIQVGKYTKGGLFGHTPDQLLTGFHLLKGHPFERHFDLTFDNIYKIANIIMGNTEGALEFKPEGVAEDSGPVDAYGYVYDRRDQRVMWSKIFPSEQAAKQWADSKNATILGTKPVQQTVEEDYVDEKK
jgi:hypothetical protein